MADTQILTALTAALDARGFAGVEPQLVPIEPPRDWGVTTNVCFALAGRAAQAQIAEQTAGLDKKEAKALAGQITREAGPKLAAELAADLTAQLGSGGVPPPDNVPTGDRRRDAAATVSRVEAEGAYINFYYDPVTLAGEVIRQVLVEEPFIAPSDVGEPFMAPEEGGLNASPTDASPTDASPTDASPTDAAPTAAPVYGGGAPTGKRIMVEYAQPNTHKDFHVGHLRNASIGQAIANLLEFEGNEVLKATYLGDIGHHVELAILGSYQVPIYGAKPVAVDGVVSHACQGGDFFTEIPDRDRNPLQYWGYVYKESKRLFEYRKCEMLVDDEEAHTFLEFVWTPKLSYDHMMEWDKYWLRLWEARDSEVRAEWQSTRDECIEGFRTIFDELQVTFDPECWFYESTVDDTHLGQQTAEELKQRSIAVVDTSEEYKGALYVDFEQQADAVKPDGTTVFRDDERKRIRKLGKMTILRSDGTSLYQTKELGLAKYKFDHFNIDESLYVVGSEQKLYFEQVFAILRLWGFPNAENCKHIAYELVVLPEGKMSSREGTVVSYRELRDEAVRRALEITREKGIVAPGQDLEQTAKDIAIASIKYAMLQVSGNQQIVFDFEQALSFDGRAAPYLQYAYARAGKLVGDAARVGQDSVPVQDSARSIASSGQAGTPVPPIPPADLKASEIALVRQLHGWPAACRLAAQRYEPAVIANYLYELASAFNDFYRDCRVLDAPDDIRPWRQSLTAAFRTVMRTGFGLLALPLPEAM